MKKSSVSLTEGGIAKSIIVFALPILAGQIFQNLYNSVDAIVVGRLVGKTALAAVTSSSDVAQMLVAFFTGLSVGAGVLFARYFGAGDRKQLHDSIHTAILFATLLGVAMAWLGILLTTPILRMVACPDDVFGEAKAYLRIYLIGIFFTSIYNVGASVLRAVGDSRNPFYYLVCASVINIVLDLLFVAYFHMGVSGVAYATIISQGVSVFLVFRRLICTDDVYKLTISELHMKKTYLIQIVNLGFPAAIQGALISISNLFVQRYVNYFGSSVMAGVGAAKKIDKFIGLIGQSTALAAMTFVSQNLGAGKKDRAFRGIYTTLGITILAIAGPCVLLYIFATPVAGIFTKDPDALRAATDMLHVMIPCFLFQTLNQIYSQGVRGFGKSQAVMWLSMIGMIGMRQLYLMISMSIHHDVVNVYIGYPLGWFFSAVFVMLYYYFTIRRPYKKSVDTGGDGCYSN